MHGNQAYQWVYVSRVADVVGAMKQKGLVVMGARRGDAMRWWCDGDGGKGCVFVGGIGVLGHSSEEATRPCGLRANLSVNMLHGRQAPPNPKFRLVHAHSRNTEHVHALYM